MSKMSFIVENGCGLECVPKRPGARRPWSKLYFTSSQNWSIGKLLLQKGRTVRPVKDLGSNPYRITWLTNASAQEIRAAANSVQVSYLEIWRPGKRL